tara:strand:+ start:1542 stop:2477 length:936 start_codon:yes stop_codon:yes gene_type:complete
MSNKNNDKQPKKNILFTDISRTDWIEALPKKVRPYFYLARMDRTIGSWLLLFPCWISYAFATLPNRPIDFNYVENYLYFMFGAMVMRSAGCVINDLWDHKIDTKVERTVGRPIASGAVSKLQAFIFLGFLLLIGLIILLQFNGQTIILGFISIIPVCLYPLAKRFTYWPQLVLGLTFNWGALMGWTAYYTSLSWEAFMLYAACICWTIGYDTIYAYQDIEDDQKIGVKSTALYFKENGKKAVAFFYALSLICFNLVFMSLWIVLPMLHFLWQIRNWDMNSQQSSLDMFKSNRIAGWLLFICSIASAWNIGI